MLGLQSVITSLLPMLIPLLHFISHKIADHHLDSYSNVKWLTTDAITFLHCNNATQHSRQCFSLYMLCFMVCCGCTKIKCFHFIIAIHKCIFWERKEAKINSPFYYAWCKNYLTHWNAYFCNACSRHYMKLKLLQTTCRQTR